MKKIALASALLVSGLALTQRAFAEDVYVITNSATTVAADDIKDIYTGEKQVEGSTKLTPIDNAALKAEFLDKVIHLTAEKYNAIWVKKGFRDGLSPPAVKSSDLEVISIVKSKPGAVGYVSKAPSDVKVIKKY